MGGEYCSVLRCNNNSNTRKKLSFFSLPKDKPTLKKWLQLIERQDILESPNTHYRVCSAHFPPTMFINKRLAKGAIPKLNLPGQVNDPLCINHEANNNSTVENEDAEHVATQTDNESADFDKLLVNEATRKLRQLKTALNASETERKKLEKRIGGLKKQSSNKPTINTRSNKTRKSKESASQPRMSVNRKRRHSNDSIIEIVDEPADRFIEWQNELKTKLNGDIDQNKLNFFAFNMYLTSPSAYKFLEKTFNLPSLKTLQNIKINIRAGVNVDIINVLSKRVKKISPTYKYCMLCLDETELNQQLYYDITNDELEGLQEINGKTKHVADKVVVAVLKGCIEYINQPLGYVFCSASDKMHNLNIWVDKTIKLLNDGGFNVCAVVSKQSPMFVKFSKLKGVSINCPRFKVDGNTVYYVFEAADVIQRIRDDLLTFDLMYNDKLISWDYVEAFYNNDKERDIRIAPQLTNKHINPNSAERTKIKYATEILCHSVAAGIATDIEMGSLPPKAQDTADFIIAINTIYNILNSSKYRVDDYELTSSDANDRLKYLRNAINMFNNIKVFPSDENANMTSFICLRITINAVLMLFDYFVANKFRHLYTGRFNNNAAELFLLSIRKTGRLVQKPSAIMFKNNFSKLTLNSLLKCMNNFEDDMESFLECKDTHGLFAKELLQVETPLLVQTTDYRFDLPTTDSFRYACGYLFKKCKQKHTCPDFQEYVQENEGEEFEVPLGLNCKIKLFNDLNTPPAEFVEYIEIFESVFLETFEEAALDAEPGNNMLNKLQNIEHYQPCPCFPVNYLIKLFIRMRIHFAVKFNNRKIKTGDNNVNVLNIEHL